MADYIYLLQNRLTPAQRQALESVRDAARARGMTVFLVGGAVRDLSSGTPVRDLDFAVQGDVSGLAEDLRAAGAGPAGENLSLASVYLLFQGGVRAELGPTLNVTYPKPGQPEMQPAAILDDLRRRDFTANAMAISLNEGSYGLLLDPLNGIADMENRELRLVSNYGFIEQPALLLRAARLTERLGWTLEERTEGRYATAKEENYIAALSERERGYELEEVFHEEDPLAAMGHLKDEGWGDIVYPGWTDAKADRDALERVRDLMGQMEQLRIHIDPSPVFFPLLTAKLPPNELSDLKASFARPGFVEQIDRLESRSKELATQMTSKSAAAPSDTWKLLFSAEPEIVLWLAYSSRSSAVQAKFRSFLNEWPQMRQRIPYSLMQEMRITPDLPGYEKLLDDLFFALIDGKLATAEATRAFLEPFSPPAPAPQVNPRRRPVKAARSRSRKAVEQISASEPEDTDSVSPEPAAVVKTGAESGDVAKASASAKTVPAKPAAAAKKVAPVRRPEATGTKYPLEKVVAVPTDASKAPVKTTIPVKQAAKTVAAKTVTKVAVVSAKQPVKTPAPEAQKAVPVKRAPVALKQSPNKVASKGVTAVKKSVAKGVVRKPEKAAAKSATRTGVSSSAPAKVAAKKQIQPAAKKTTSKGSASPKKAVKVAAKGRSSR